MNDLAERLRQIERNPSPDLWEEIASRPAQASATVQPSGWRRATIIAASLAIGFAAVAWVVVAFRPESGPPSIGSVTTDGSRLDISRATDGSLSASWTYGDTVRLGVPVDVLASRPTVNGAEDQSSPKPGPVSEFLGIEGFSIDWVALGAVEPTVMSIPADVPIASSEETVLLAFRAGEGQGAGYVEWGEMTILRTPTDLRLLESGGRYRIVVVGGGTDDALDDALFQFAFDIDIMPQPSATDDVSLLVSSSGPSSDLALLTGTLTTEGGCIAVSTGPDSSVYVIWPEGYSLAEEGGGTWLMDDSGNRVAAIGDEVEMGGGSTNLAHAEPSVPGGIPSSCAVGGPDSYWFAGTPQLMSTDTAAAMQAHAEVEAILAELWTQLARTDELQGEIQAATQRVSVLLTDIGDGTPSADQAKELGQLRSLIRRWQPSLDAGRARIEQLRARLESRRGSLDDQLARVDPTTFPTSLKVTCTGDFTGGTAASTPMVLSRDGTVQMEVTNAIPNEPVYLDVGGGVRTLTIPAGATVTRELASPLPTHLQIVCTYETPTDSWARPPHVVVVADPG